MIGDFGTARRLGEITGFTTANAGSLVRTFCPPESLNDSKPTLESDVHAFASLALRMTRFSSHKSRVSNLTLAFIRRFVKAPTFLQGKQRCRCVQVDYLRKDTCARGSPRNPETSRIRGPLEFIGKMLESQSS